MLRMVIADDESLVREGIKSIINWADYRIKIVGEAAEGKEAFELCMKLKPDILFTDIRMPFMDGLEVAQKLKDESLEVKVIIFSGLQDFNYAKTAVDVSAEGYILKPLEVYELKDVITKVVGKIGQEKSNRERLLKLREQLKENMIAASEKFLSSLLLGSFVDEEEVVEKLDYFNNPFCSKEGIIIAALTIDNYSKIKESYLEKDKQLLNFAITNVVNEIIRTRTKGISFCMNDNQFISIFNCNENNLEEINEMHEKIVHELNKLLDISVSIGTSRIINNVLEIPFAFKESINALQYKFYTGKSSILNIADIDENYSKIDYVDFYEAESKLINAIKIGDVHGSSSITADIFTRLKTNSNYKMEYIQSICSEIILMASRTVYESGENIRDIVNDKIFMLDTIQNIENIFQLEIYISELLKKITEFFSKKYTNKNDKIVSDIKSIICREYMTEISVNKIAQRVFLSPNYISLIFKKETGVTITDYLTGIRIEKSKELLKDTELLIQQVSEMVGYEDASYFSKVFKKITGIHPLRYRSFISD